MLEILPELMGQLMSVQTCFSRAVFRAMLSGHLHTPRHLQGVGDQFLWRESPEQCHPDICTLPDTSREWGTSCSRGNLQKESPEQCHPDICTLPDTSRECGTSSSRLHLQKTDFQSPAHF